MNSIETLPVCRAWLRSCLAPYYVVYSVKPFNPSRHPLPLPEVLSLLAVFAPSILHVHWEHR